MNHRDIFSRLDSTKQARVLEAAIDEFAEQGFSLASMNRVVQRGGIAKGSLFQYFGSKEGLFRFIFDHAVELVRKSLRQVKQETASADFFERISQSLLTGIHFIARHPRIYQIYLKMIFQENFPLRSQFLQQVHLFSADYLKPLVEGGIARGELGADLNVDLTVFFLDASDGSLPSGLLRVLSGCGSGALPGDARRASKKSARNSSSCSETDWQCAERILTGGNLFVLFVSFVVKKEENWSNG